MKSIDGGDWRAFLQGWSPPRTTDKEGDIIVTPEIDWSTNNVAIASFNSKALNVFSVVDKNMFRFVVLLMMHRIFFNSSLKDQISVRLRILTTQFETLRML